MSEHTRKACTKCGEVKPLVDFYRSARAKDGRTWQCKSCARLAARANARDRSNRRPVPPPSGMKVCNRCGIEKASSEFHRRTVASDGLNSACKTCANAARKEWVSQHSDEVREDRARRRLAMTPDQREAHAAKAREWRKENPERVAENGARWARENKQRLAAAKKAWEQANKERRAELAIRNRDHRREVAAAWRARSRHKLTERQRRRRVDKLGLVIGNVDVDALWTGHCGLCGEPMDWALKHPHPMSKSIDHITPLALGGTHEEHNLHWAHLRCNLRKGAKPLTG